MRGVPFTVAILWAIYTATSAHAQPRITFEGRRVVAEGITAGGQAVWFSVAHERDEWLTHLVRRDGILRDDDRDGSVWLESESGVPRLSVWAVVDFESGEFALAAPAGAGVREVEFPGESVRRGPRGGLEVLENRRQYLEILLVRPGVGAWGVSVGDGGASDSDHTPDGTIRAVLGSMRPLATSDIAPGEFRAGDVVVVVAPDSMEIWAAALGGGRQ